MSGSETSVIKARGLPWSATAKDVTEFFNDVQILNGHDGIHFTYTREGRPSGECFIEVVNPDDLTKALAHDNEHMGKRYIEVKQAKHSEMEWVVNRMPGAPQDPGPVATDGVVRLRGLPYGCSKQDIAEFFTGLQISPYGITVTMDQDGRASGDAYVEFATQQDADKALEKHKEKIGHRYIEIFKSSKADIKYVINTQNNDRPMQSMSMMNSRPGPYDRPSNFGPRARGRGGMNLGPSGFNSNSSFGGGYDMRGSRGGKGGPMRGGRQGLHPASKLTPQNSKTGHSIHMRGLPFEATTKDVMSFFAPINPVDVRFIFEPNGRPKGECDVDFSSHNDAEAAMQKDKQNMGHRYIELFMKSTPNSGMGWNNNTNMMPNQNMRNNMGGNFDNYSGGYNDNYSGGYGGNQMNNGPPPPGGMGRGGFNNFNSFNDNVTYPMPNQPQQPGGGNFFMR